MKNNLLIKVFALIYVAGLLCVPVQGTSDWESDMDQSGAISGDMDGNGQVDNKDVEYLLWHTLYPEDFPLPVNGDFDNSDTVDNKDVEYLLWHTLYPEDYPLTPHSHTHSYRGTVTKAATCSTEGIKTFICACGDKYTETIARTAHKYVDTVTKPTCINEGYTTHKCSVCSDTYTDGKTKALGHNYTSEVVKPTCTTGGYTKYDCTRCDAYYYDAEKAALGHDYIDTVVKPTCTIGGYTKHDCSRCSDSYTDAKTNATGHSYTVTSNTATCTANGTKTETCSVCGNTKTSTSKATGHVNTTTETKNATCIAAGYTKVTCKDCGTVISNTTTPKGKCHYITKRLSDAAKLYRDKWGWGSGYGEYLNYTDWNVDMCEGCYDINEDTIRFAYSDYEAAVIMLGYVNDLRESVYGTDEYNLTLDSSLIQWAKERAKEISIPGNFHHGNAPCPENITNGGVGIYAQFTRWKNSSGHYAAMIDKDYKTFGYALYRSDTGAIYGSQLFNYY